MTPTEAVVIELRGGSVKVDLIWLPALYLGL